MKFSKQGVTCALRGHQCGQMIWLVTTFPEATAKGEEGRSIVSKTWVTEQLAIKYHIIDGAMECVHRGW